jgi:hypothetical protein
MGAHFFNHYQHLSDVLIFTRGVTAAFPLSCLNLLD